jgi:2-polyprenyl-3-methyl-5-hydroxy-6-metoxy-1,4-benzoquinol methylase
MLKITQCPICEGKSFTPYLTCIDHTVSHETFQLVKCENCQFIITSPRPENDVLGKYYISDDYISHSNRSSTVVEKVYQFARNYSLNWKVGLLNKYSRRLEKTLLDYGCGTGEFLSRAKSHGYAIRGVEPSGVARHQAETLTNEKIAETVEQVNDNFDAITLWHVLEHVPNLNEVMSRLKSSLKETGTMFIAVPNHQSHDAYTYQEFWAGYDVPRHLWHFSKDSMKKILTRHGLKLNEIIPMKLDSFYVSMLSEKYQRKKNSVSGLTNAFLTGLKSNMKAASSDQYSSLIYVASK